MVEEEKKKKARPRKKEEPKEAPKEQEPPKEAEAPKAETKPEAPVEAPKAEHKAEAPKAEKEPRKRRKAAPKKQARVFVARGKRKESIARATISEGRGTIRVNSVNIESMGNRYVRDIIREPLRYVGPEANSVDIAVNVNGGGMMGQAQAARTAIANALVMYFDQMGLRQKFIEIDRSMVIEDTRRVEPKKFRGPKARARFQKSYR